MDPVNGMVGEMGMDCYDNSIYPDPTFPTMFSGPPAVDMGTSSWYADPNFFHSNAQSQTYVSLSSVSLSSTVSKFRSQIDDITIGLILQTLWGNHSF